MNSGIQIVVAVAAMATLVSGQNKADESKGAEFHGEYRNLAGYAYHVVLPPGIMGHKAPAPAPAHGFAVELEPSAKAQIWVDGSYNVAFYPSALSAIQDHVKWLKEEAKLIGQPAFRQSHMAALPASQLLVHYRNRKDGEERVREEILAIRKSHPDDTMGIVYTIGLDTTPGRFSLDHETLLAIAKTFDLDPINP